MSAGHTHNAVTSLQGETSGLEVECKRAPLCSVHVHVHVQLCMDQGTPSIVCCVCVGSCLWTGQLPTHTQHTMEPALRRTHTCCAGSQQTSDILHLSLQQQGRVPCFDKSCCADCAHMIPRGSTPTSLGTGGPQSLRSLKRDAADIQWYTCICSNLGITQPTQQH